MLDLKPLHTLKSEILWQKSYFFNGFFHYTDSIAWVWNIIRVPVFLMLLVYWVDIFSVSHMYVHLHVPSRLLFFTFKYKLLGMKMKKPSKNIYIMYVNIIICTNTCMYCTIPRNTFGSLLYMYLKELFMTVILALKKRHVNLIFLNAHC